MLYIYIAYYGIILKSFTVFFILQAIIFKVAYDEIMLVLEVCCFATLKLNFNLSSEIFISVPFFVCLLFVLSLYLMCLVEIYPLYPGIKLILELSFNIIKVTQIYTIDTDLSHVFYILGADSISKNTHLM